MPFTPHTASPVDCSADEADMLAAMACNEASAFFPAWDVKVLDEFLREIQQGDDLLEVEDFFAFDEQELDA
jgi:hypothetical protein